MENEISICAKCKIEVKDGKSLFCDGFCCTWFHTSCVKIDDKSFQKISDLGDKVLWMCEVCLEKLGNMKTYVCDSDDYTNLHDMMGKLFKIVKGLSEDNISINTRLNTLNDSNERLENLVLNIKPEVLQALENRFQTLSSARRIISDDEDYDDSEEKHRDEIESGPMDGVVCAKKTKTNKEEESESEPGKNTLTVVGDANKENVCLRQESELETSLAVQDGKKGWKTVTHQRGKSKRNRPINSPKSHSSTGSKNLGNKSNANLDSVNSDSLHKVNSQAKSYVDALGSRPSKSTRPKPLVIGSVSSGDGLGLGLVGQKRAWFHLGKLKGETSTEDVTAFLGKHISDRNFVVEKLESKGSNASFKLGIDFDLKDKVIDSSIWPKYVTLRRFLFKRPLKPLLR